MALLAHSVSLRKTFSWSSGSQTIDFLANDSSPRLYGIWKSDKEASKLLFVGIETLHTSRRKLVIGDELVVGGIDFQFMYGLFSPETKECILQFSKPAEGNKSTQVTFSASQLDSNDSLVRSNPNNGLKWLFTLIDKFPVFDSSENILPKTICVIKEPETTVEDVIDESLSPVVVDESLSPDDSAPVDSLSSSGLVASLSSNDQLAGCADIIDNKKRKKVPKSSSPLRKSSSSFARQSACEVSKEQKRQAEEASRKRRGVEDELAANNNKRQKRDDDAKRIAVEKQLLAAEKARNEDLLHQAQLKRDAFNAARRAKDAERKAAQDAEKKAAQDAAKKIKTANAKAATTSAFNATFVNAAELAAVKKLLAESNALHKKSEKISEGYKAQLITACQASNVIVTETRAGNFKVVAVEASPSKLNSRLSKQQVPREVAAAVVPSAPKDELISVASIATGKLPDAALPANVSVSPADTVVVAISTGASPVAIDATTVAPLSLDAISKQWQDSLAELKGMTAMIQAASKVAPKADDGTPSAASLNEPVGVEHELRRESAVVSVHGQSHPSEDRRLGRDLPRPGSYHDSVRGAYYESEQPRLREVYDSRQDSFVEDGRRSEGSRYSHHARGGMPSYDRHDGSRSYDRQDGSRSFERQDGSRSYDRQDGSRSFERQDGSRLYDRQDGSRPYDRDRFC